MWSPISIIGVSTFLYPTFFYKSKRSLLIFINGLLYHGTKNKYLLYNDVFCNLLFTYYTVYHHKISRKYATLGTIFWILNNYLYHSNHINQKSSDIFHVVGTQWILLIGLVKALQEKRLSKLSKLLK